MKQIQTMMAVLSLIGMLYIPVSYAQQRERLPSQTPSRSMEEPAPPVKATTPEAPAVPKASIFIGSSVTNQQGDNLGKIDDLVIDPATGRITYAALSHGSVLGLGGKLFAVSWEALTLQPDGKTFVLNVPKETLESAPGFDKNHWPARPDPLLSASATGAGTGTQPAAPAMAEASVSATVQAVNASAETITLTMEHGKRVELQAPAAMLADLQAGDTVEVKMSGTRATEIHKK
jgi:sporulation protein YlmC with PRC-barrel domain